MMTNTKTIAAPVATICFYGNREIGFDYLAQYTAGTAVRFTPNSQPDPRTLRFTTSGLTGTLIGALEDLRRVGVTEGVVRLFGPGGERYADHRIGDPIWYGSQSWMSVAAEAAS